MRLESKFSNQLIKVYFKRKRKIYDLFNELESNKIKQI